MEEEKSVRNNGVVGKNIVEPNKSIVVETLEEVDRNDEVNNRTNNGPVRSTGKDLTGEKVRKLVKTPRPQPVRFYLKHKINKELIEGLVENPRFNDSLLAMQSGKIECEAYHSLPVEPMRKAMLKKMITKMEDMGGNFVIPCNIGGLKYMYALVDQGSDLNVMPLSTYNRLTGKKLVETDIRLSLASQSHIYPLGIAEDVLVKIADFIYPVDFVIIDIKEDRKRPFILGTPFLTTAKAEISFLELRKEQSYMSRPWIGAYVVLSPFLEHWKAHLLEDKQIPTLGWLLEGIHVTWAHLEKKQTRLQLYTKSLEENAYNGWRRRHNHM
ncbi:reverse transcriptase domain-containing protein [Tanacetum coccineum]